MDNKIKVFEDKQIRATWDEKSEQWYFSVIDVCEVLAEATNPRRYWSDLKRKLKAEGSQLYEEIVQLKMQSSDGKYYNTDVATTEQLLRLIQSIPSKRAEPFKLWLARIGNERLDEIANPEQAIDRAFETYIKKGYSERWINQRIKSMEVRKGLTDEFKRASSSSGICFLSKPFYHEKGLCSSFSFYLSTLFETRQKKHKLRQKRHNRFQAA